MKLGAEPKKVAALGGLLVVALAVYLFNSSGSSSDVPAPTPTVTSTPAANTPAPAALPAPSGAPASSSTKKGRSSAEFRIRVGPGRNSKEVVDPMTIDPTLRVDVLAKLQTVDVTGTHRSLFDFAAAPPPKVDTPKVAASKVKVPDPNVAIAPVKPVDTAKTEPQTLKAPPVPMKFFGYVSPRGEAQKRAFFMEGEEIHIVREGDVVKRRYKIVRIGVNSVTVEDTNFPGSPQTLPLEEQPG